jgi:hypothetical protein
MQHAMRMRHIVMCDLPVSEIFFSTYSQTERFSGKKGKNMKRVI